MTHPSGRFVADTCHMTRRVPHLSVDVATLCGAHGTGSRGEGVGVRRRCRRCDGERGASLVEFALILPVFMMLVLGMVTGAQAYNRQMTMHHAVREGARYGATLSTATPLNNGACVGGGPGTPSWELAVKSEVVARSSNSINCGQVTCVALVTGLPGSETVVNGHSTTGAKCYSDAAGTDAGDRVQVTADRGPNNDKLEVLIFNVGLRLKSQATARYEK